MNNLNFSVVAFALACAAGAAQADILSSDPYALGGGRHYSQTNAPVTYHGAFFDVFATLEFTMTGPAHDPDQGTKNLGSSGQDCGMEYDARVKKTHMTGQSSYVDVLTGVSSDGLTRFYDTEMLSMDLAGVDPVLGPVMIRESPIMESTGKYYITAVHHFDGPADTEFRITSFFDIFTELSLDGGQTWTPSDGAMHMELDGPTVPAPGVAGLMALSGAFVGRRRRNS